MPEVILLSENSRKILMEYLETVKRRSLGPPGRPAVEDDLPQSPDAYVVKSPVGGIPARVSTVLGSASCEVYQLLSGVLTAKGFYKTVSNTSSTAVSGNSFLLAIRDKFGTWVASQSGGGVDEGGGSDQHSYIGTTELPFYTYYYSGLPVAITDTNPDTGYIYASPIIVPNARTIDRLAVYFTDNAGTIKTCRIGIYQTASNSSPWPTSLVTETGTISLPISSTDGFKYEDLATPISLSPGLYWAAVQVSAYGPTLNGVYPPEVHYSPFGASLFGGGTTPVGAGAGVKVANAYGAFPATFPAYSALTDFPSTGLDVRDRIPIVYFHYSG